MNRINSVFALDICSSRNWQSIKNNSWGENHVSKHGDKPGYLICYKQDLYALASVIGQPFVKASEIEANAKLIEQAPQMAAIIRNLSEIDIDDLNEIESCIAQAKDIFQKLMIKIV